MGRRAREQKRQRRTMCDGKAQLDRLTANEVATRMRRKRTIDTKHVSAYQCRFCGRWHVGSTITPRDERS